MEGRVGQEGSGGQASPLKNRVSGNKEERLQKEATLLDEKGTFKKVKGI